MRNKTDLKYLGKEPEVSPHPSLGELAKSLNWYRHFYSYDDREIYDWLEEYLVSQGNDPAEVKSYVNFGSYSKTICYLARLLSRGLAEERYRDRVLGEFAAFLTARRRPQKTSRPSAKHEDNPLVADIDLALDALYDSDYKKRPDTEFLSALEKYPSRKIRRARDHVEDLYEELVSKDPQVREAYSHLSKKAMTNYVAFVKEILSRLDQEKENAKRKRATSKGATPTLKAKSDFSKMKYLHHDPATGVTSESNLFKIATASVVYLYNTKYREVTRLVAGDAGFSVKGTTIRGFCEERSSRKRVRKPGEVVPGISLGTKKSCASLFESLRSKEQAPAGRTNENTIVLKILR